MVKQQMLADDRLSLVKLQVKPGDWIVHLQGDKEVVDAYGCIHK